jgi:hypothetical protein
MNGPGCTFQDGGLRGWTPVDVLPSVCKQGVGGSSPPSSTWENDPGRIIKEAIDTRD